MVPAYHLFLVKQLANKEQCSNTFTILYFFDLAPADFYLSRLKSVLKGQLFCDITDMVQNVTEK